MNSQPKDEDQSLLKIKIVRYLEGLMGREPSESEIEKCRQSLFHLGKALTRIAVLRNRK